MSELGFKLDQLNEIDRVRLYRELVERRGASSSRPVRELALVYKKDAAVNLEKLRKLVASRLPAHEQPTRFVAVDSLPRTSHGKIDRPGLPGLLRFKQTVPDAPHAGDDPNLSAAVAAFRSVLGTVPVGPDANFFELGGHSLLAVEFILKIAEATGRRISITQFFNYPTPRGVAAFLNYERRQSLDYVYPVSERQTGLPIFVFSASRLAYALKSHRADWTIYGIQMRWHDDDDKEIHYRDLEALASCIAAEINQVCSGDDFILAGSSFPAVVAFEVARQLGSSGRKPRLTILIDPTYFSGARTWIEKDLQAFGLLRESDNHTLTWLVLNNPLRRRFWRRAYRFAEISWARLLSRRTVGQTAANMQLANREAVTKKAIDKTRLTALWRKFRPAKYSGPTVLLTGEHGWRYKREWRKLFDDERAVHSMDIHHLEILTEPFMSANVVPVFCDEVDSAMECETE